MCESLGQSCVVRALQKLFNDCKYISFFLIYMFAISNSITLSADSPECHIDNFVSNITINFIFHF